MRISDFIIQNLNIDHIASKRRNPIIADIFGRMNYMERRGSGFKKIKDDYYSAVNFNTSLAPKFHSTPSSFFVTLYNLNYNNSIEKAAFENEKAAFERSLAKMDANAPTKEKVAILFDLYGYEHIFSRADIVYQFSMASSSSGKLINKLKDTGFIQAVSGQGKGKYRFIKK